MGTGLGGAEGSRHSATSASASYGGRSRRCAASSATALTLAATLLGCSPSQTASPPQTEAPLCPYVPPGLLRCERPEPPNAAGELVDLAAGWVAVYQAGMVCYFNLEAVRSILEAERVE